MNYEQEQQFAAEVKRYVTEHLPLSQISDSELQQQIEDIVEQRIGAGYGTLQNYPYTAKMRCTDSAPKKRKEWRNERHFAGKVE